MAERVRNVVSVSLGSATRDKSVTTTLRGEPFAISRLGTDGDLRKAEQTIRALDGTVDAIGLGGIDVFLYTVSHRYTLPQGHRLMRAATTSLVADGSGLKNSLERRVISQLVRERPEIPIAGEKVLMVCAMDRFGMAEALVAAGCQMTFGDLIFTFDRDQPIRSLTELAEVAEKLMPDITRGLITIRDLYAIGAAQEAPPNPKYPVYYDEAHVIAGDFHFIRKFMTPRLAGKVIITNTVTDQDVAELRSRGVAWLITTTPNLAGRSFGTNVLEAALLVLLAKPQAEVTPDEYLALIEELRLEPRIERLN